MEGVDSWIRRTALRYSPTQAEVSDFVTRNALMVLAVWGSKRTERAFENRITA